MSFVASEGYKNYVKESVVRHINENGKLPSRKEMLNKNISIDPLVNTYGGWNNVLKALGFKRDKVEENISDEETMNKLVALYQRLGTAPTLTQLKQEKINIKGLQNKFGSYNNIKRILKGEISEEQAELQKTKRNAFDLDETREELIALTKELGNVPTVKQAKNKGINVSRLISMFGNWSNAKKELDLYSTQEEAVVDEIIELQKQTIKRPSIQKMKENHIKITPLIKKYGSWKKVCNVLNLSLYDLDTIKSEILQIAQAINKTPSLYELTCYGVNVKPLSEYYGGWYNIVREMELDKFDENKIIEQIHQVANEIDKTPTIKDLKEHHIKTNKIFKSYGGWNNLRDSIGLPKLSRYTNSYLQGIENQLLSLGKMLGRTPKLEEAKNYGIQTAPLINRYGSWNNLLFKLGFKLNSNYTDEAIDALTMEIQDLANKLGKTPTAKDLKAHNISINPLKRKFGSLGKCLMSIGLKPRLMNKSLYDRDSILMELRELSEKLGKTPSRATAKKYGIKTHSLMADLGNWTNVKNAINDIIIPVSEDKHLKLA